MILISRKVDYGILILCHLTRASAGCSARELADHFGLSRPFIANILKLLCQEGFVESQRGVNGGYRLSVDPRMVTLESVINALDGPFQLMSCVNPNDTPGCGLANVCPVRSPLRLVHDKIQALLSEVTLEELADQGRSVVTLDMESLNGCVANLSGQ